MSQKRLCRVGGSISVIWVYFYKSSKSDYSQLDILLFLCSFHLSGVYFSFGSIPTISDFFFFGGGGFRVTFIGCVCWVLFFSFMALMLSENKNAGGDLSTASRCTVRMSAGRGRPHNWRVTGNTGRRHQTPAVWRHLQTTSHCQKGFLWSWERGGLVSICLMAIKRQNILTQ